MKGGGAVNSGEVTGISKSVQSGFPRAGEGQCPFPPEIFYLTPAISETGDAVVDVGVCAEQLGHAAAEEGGDDEHFRRGGVAVLHGNALVP